MFLGVSFFSGVDAIPIAPTMAGNDTYVGVKNARYDNLYITRDTSTKIDESLPDGWNNDTILYGTYNTGSLSASNINYLSTTVDHLVIKRRVKGTNHWMTIAVKEIEDFNDINIEGVDLTAAANRTYEYAVVPVYQMNEGDYNIAEIECLFDGIFLSEIGEIYGTIINAQYEVQRQVPSTTIELFNHKYPKYVSNSIANYDKGTVTGSFVRPADECDKANGATDAFDIYNNWAYRKAFKDFLTDRKPKILKTHTGDLWLVNIVEAPSETGEIGSSSIRTLSFQWVEIGDAESESDLYYAGISKITREWWSSSV